MPGLVATESRWAGFQLSSPEWDNSAPPIRRGQLGAANSATGQFGTGPTRRGRFGAGTFRRSVCKGALQKSAKC